MKAAKILVIATLLGAPGLASAMCQDKHQVMSCDTGMVWDHDSQSCITQVTS
jgi:hypothetical protein